MLSSRRTLIALATVIVALVATSTAYAATAEVKGATVVYDVDLQNPFAQSLAMTLKDGRFVFTESGSEIRQAIRAQTGCRKDDDKVMSCSASGVTSGVIETELQDDNVIVDQSVTIPIQFSMGQGGDTAKGGAGADTFLGGTAGIGDDTFEGRGGNDVFQSGVGADVMRGGDGAGDKADYGARIVRQALSLDGEANDGDPTDLAGLSSIGLSGADNLLDIEKLTAGSGPDTLIGNDAANTLDGAQSEDTLEGRGGADTYVGGKGNDEILARSAKDGVPDPDASISCGDGNDTVEADPEDGPVISSDCEDIDCGGCEISKAPGQAPASPGIAAIDPPGGANDADEGAGKGGGGAPAGGGAALAPRVSIVSGGVVPLKKNGRIPVRILCLYRADHCKGSLTLKTKSKISVRVGRRTKTFARNATIAKANLAPIRWGNSAPVQLKANAVFRAILPLLRKHSTKVQAILVSQDTAGGVNAPTARATGDLVVSAGTKGKRR